MEGNENVKMSHMVDKDFKNEDTEEFDGNDNNFDEKTSLFARHDLVDDFDSESESPASKSKTVEMDRSLYMENTVSSFAAALHIIKGNLGLGILGLPFAVMNAGLVVGPLMIFFTGLVVLHCMHMLMESSHVFCDRSKQISLDYAEVAEMAMGLYFPRRKSLGGLLVNTFLLITQLGFCCVYFIFVGESFKQIFSHIIIMDVKVWVAIFLVPVILFSFIRTLKVMTILSGVSNVLYAAGLLCLLIYAGQTVQDPTTLPKFVGFSSLPISFGTIVFAFEAIGVVLPVENMMKLPGKFRQVINIAMSLILVTSTLFGTLGYLSCGMKCHGSFTLDLPTSTFGEMVKLMFAIAILFTYFIQFYVPITIILPPLKEKVNEKYHTLLDLGVRTALVCFTAIMAVSIPQLGHMISLVGAFGSASLAITFPALIHLAVLHHDQKLDKFTLLKDALIVAVGVLGTVAGVFVSVVDIIWTFQHGDQFTHHYRHLHHANLTVALDDSIV